MKDNALVKTHRGLSQESKKRLITFALSLLLGALFSGLRFSDRLSPFGVSAVAALPSVYSFFAALGGILGYAAIGSLSLGVRYIAEMLILIAVKWAFAAFLEGDRKWALPTLAAAANLAVGAVWLFTKEIVVYDILYLVAESIICAGAAYFISQVFKIFDAGGAMQSSENVVAFSVCAALLLMSLSNVVVGMVSLGHIIAALLVMSMSLSLGALGGAAAGLSVGAAISLSLSDGGFSVMALGLGGMLSGLFSHLSRYAVSVLFLLCTLLSVAVASVSENSLYLLYEVLSAAAIFLLIPERYIRALGVYFPPLSKGSEYYPNKYLSARLDFVSKSLLETSRSICEMSSVFAAKKSGDLDRVFGSAADKVCRRCAMKLGCWNGSYNETMDAFNHMAPALKRQGRVEPENVPDLLRHRCVKMASLVAEINSAYRKSVDEAQAELRNRQIREVVCEQFSGMSKMLCEMSQELSLTMCDRSLENRITSELLREGVAVRDVSCPVDRFGRKTVEFYCLSEDADKLNALPVEENISDLCGCDMKKSGAVKTGELTRLSFSEAPPYKLQTAFYQKSAEGEEVCGDSFAFLPLSNGFSAAVLSDGMGRGKSACADSKMTVGLISRFLNLGFPLESCVSLVNSSLMLKNEQEALSTLDACIFDLYSGGVSIKKAGAAPTFVKRAKRVSKVEIGALPLGILGKVGLKGADLRLCRGDTVVMGSDGLCALKDSQIESILKKSDNLSLDALATALGERAAGAEGAGAGDDITVLVMRIV